MRHNATSSADHPAAPATERRDSPGVRIPPPVYFLIAFLIGWLLQARFPLPFLARPIALSLGIALVAAAALLIIAAIPTMLRGHGTLKTDGPSAALVMSGPYRISRNPMYLGLVLLYGGLACVFAIDWALPLLIPLILYTQVGTIVPEERYLERSFGESYRAYRSRVRRWL
ncbi:MAG TPA: isoprenylcysteine carboxylmethyltransferase family protein [Ktedonobacterales bacterium]|nr:isoprenylcysteine carboxylmethyltransferase family protein [Ktedonobacterales bacterium]